MPVCFLPPGPECLNNQRINSCPLLVQSVLTRWPISAMTVSSARRTPFLTRKSFVSAGSYCQDITLSQVIVFFRENQSIFNVIQEGLKTINEGPHAKREMSTAGINSMDSHFFTLCCRQQLY
ncbi:hypothetical protein LG58_18 [Kosakonia radicincitans YD4]|nr:hypothetical protein LG58_18 [Kosakonia radicincitans YD4]